MEKEYSTEVKGLVHSYRFEKWEKQLIADAIIPKINLKRRKIRAIENNPKNEGQVRYQQQIDILYREIQILNGIIEEFKK